MTIVPWRDESRKIFSLKCGKFRQNGSRTNFVQKLTIALCYPKTILAIWRFIIYFYCNYLVLLQREKDEFPGKINKPSLFVNRKVDFGISYYLNNFQKWVSLRVIISIVRSLRRITANLQDVGRRSYFKCRKVSQVKIGCLLLIVNRRIYL